MQNLNYSQGNIIAFIYQFCQQEKTGKLYIPYKNYLINVTVKL